MKKVRENLARVIGSARKKKGLTQCDVAKEMRIAQSTLSKIEAGKLVPSIILWIDLAEMLEIKYPDLIKAVRQ